MLAGLVHLATAARARFIITFYRTNRPKTPRAERLCAQVIFFFSLPSQEFGVVIFSRRRWQSVFGLIRKKNPPVVMKHCACSHLVQLNIKGQHRRRRHMGHGVRPPHQLLRRVALESLFKVTFRCGIVFSAVDKLGSVFLRCNWPKGFKIRNGSLKCFVCLSIHPSFFFFYIHLCIYLFIYPSIYASSIHP